MITVLGLGTFGSHLADVCTRNGAPVKHVIDRDTVEAKNISKSIYRRSHIGRHKVEAIAEHLEEISGASPRQICKFAQELDAEEWKAVLDQTDILIECCDSKEGISEVVKRLREYHAASGRDIALVKAFALDNAAGGVVTFWTPGSGLHCPACLIQSVPYLNSCDERVGSTDPDYCFDQITGSPVRGILPDILYGISFTATLVQALVKSMNGEHSGRNNLLRTLAQHNMFLWSTFRDPYLDWQNVEVMGTVRPLDFATPSPCLACGRNADAEPIVTEPSGGQSTPRLLSMNDIGTDCLGDGEDDRYYGR